MKPVFVVSTPTRDTRTFAAVARQARALRPFGRVEVSISALAQKAVHEVPPGGSPWHEYADCGPSLHKFFPPPALAPFLPTRFVAANQRLLLAKASILRRLKLGAAFWSYEPNFFPEAFFEAYPHLRGPRVDHPRRSLREEFAPCLDRPETQVMYAGMARELARRVPHLGTFFFKTNDAGPGLCWADWQYSGPNGPAGCRTRGAGPRVRSLLESLRGGAAAAGVNLTLHIGGNFSRDERTAIQAALPEACFLRGEGRTVQSVASMADVCYPVRGIVDPVGILKAAARIQGGGCRSVFVDLRTYYDRSGDRLDASAKVFEVLAAGLRTAPENAAASAGILSALCRKWVGLRQADTLLAALVTWHELLGFRQAELPGVSTIYGGVSLRYITRPLVAVPERLSAAEESAFLPYVFNVRREEARRDYIDTHGGRRSPTPTPATDLDPRAPAFAAFHARLEAVYTPLEGLTGGGSAPFFRRMGAALRAYGSIVRSCANFHAAQVVRDRHATALSGPPRVPSKEPTWTGEPDLLLFNAIMRDELDNAAELRTLLQADPDILFHAARQAEEDTFVLGPDLTRQLLLKQQIMRRHWRDIEDYLQSPFK